MPSPAPAVADLVGAARRIAVAARGWLVPNGAQRRRRERRCRQRPVTWSTPPAASAPPTASGFGVGLCPADQPDHRRATAHRDRRSHRPGADREPRAARVSPPGSRAAGQPTTGCCWCWRRTTSSARRRLQVGYGSRERSPIPRGASSASRCDRRWIRAVRRAAATAAAQAIQKTLTAAGVTPDHSGRKRFRGAAGWRSLFALASIYFILMFVAIGIFSKRLKASRLLRHQRPLAAVAAAAYVWRPTASGAHGGWACVVVGLCWRWRHRSSAIHRQRKCCSAGASRKLLSKTDWKPRIPYVWSYW